MARMGASATGVFRQRTYRAFELSLSAIFLCTVASALFNAFAVYWLTRDGAALYLRFSHFNFYVRPISNGTGS